MKKFFWPLILVILLSIAVPLATASEKVRVVGGNRTVRPISDFAMSNIGNGVDFYVDSGGDGSGRAGRTPRASVPTLATAISLATADRGDVIHLLAGHAETLSTSVALDISKTGLTIVCHGEGALKPTFTFGTVDATITVSAANTSFSGFRVTPSVDSVVSPIVVSAPGCYIEAEIFDGSASVEFVSGILTTAAADNLTLDITYKGFLAGNACVAPIRLVGGDNVTVNIDFYGEASTAVVEFHTTLCSNVLIGGYWYNDNTALTKNVVDTIGSSLWFVSGYDGKGGYSFSGGSASALASTSTGGTDANVSAILTDTGTTIPGTITTVQSSLDALNLQEPLFAVQAYADLTGEDFGTATFTVTGDVMVRVVGVVGATAITTTSGTTTLSIGTTEAVAAIIAASTVDNSDFAATDVWVNSTPTDDAEQMTEDWVIIGGGADIIITRNVDDLTAGALSVYCWWKPLSVGATVVAP